MRRALRFSSDIACDRFRIPAPVLSPQSHSSWSSLERCRRAAAVCTTWASTRIFGRGLGVIPVPTYTPKQATSIGSDIVKPANAVSDSDKTPPLANLTNENTNSPSVLVPYGCRSFGSNPSVTCLVSNDYCFRCIRSGRK